LTKPPGSLGQLETLAVKLAALLNDPTPCIEQPQIVLFAADHGVVAEGVSAFPQVVTGEMIRNFSRGGAAIAVLAAAQNIPLHVVNLGTAHEMEALDRVTQANIMPGTENFTQAPAMTGEQYAQALAVGKDAVEQLFEQGGDLFMAGEMGIGNTTSATAIAAALMQVSAESIAGAGTGLDAAGIEHKAQVIEQGIALHALTQQSSVHEILQCVGGLEIAALCGAYIRCGQLGIPVLVDGFICTVAALAATRMQANAGEWFIYAHQSAEAGHQTVLAALDATPLLSLDMRLGEASGAAVALPLVLAACTLHGGMATFDEAEVSGG